MGIVFEVEPVSLQRRVTLKVLPRQKVLQPEERERFETEAQLAAGLHHSNIIPIHGCGSEDGCQFDAMQLIDGTPRNELKSEDLKPKRNTQSHGRVFPSRSPGTFEMAICRVAGHERGP